MELRLLLSLIPVLFLSCKSDPSKKQPGKQLQNINREFHAITFQTTDRLRLDSDVVLRDENLPQLIERVEKAELKTISSTNEMPAVTQKFLYSVSDDNFRAADIGEPWQSTDVIIESLPKRGLIYLGISKEFVLMSYYTGRLTKQIHIILIEFDSVHVTNFWSGETQIKLEDKEQILGYLKKMLAP